MNFKDLETLFLDNNKISNIEVFENSKLINLERLELTNNNIDKDKFSLLISNLKIDTIYIWLMKYLLNVKRQKFILY